MSIKELKERLFPKGVRRTVERQTRRVFLRTTEKRLVRTFRALEIPDGAVVCIHAKLSAMGHLVGGPAVVFRALQVAVPDVTVVMPTFPFGGTMLDYLDANAVYDAASTPSASGLLSDCFRQLDGVRRSLHPTHPSAALGPRAEEIIAGSEHATTPFGDDSAYGRYTQYEDAYQLLLHTNSTSIVHRVQELVGMPNLFLEEQRVARGIGPDGTVASYPSTVHTPRIPLFVAVPNGQGGKQYVWLPDYCALFPSPHRQTILDRLGDPEVRRAMAQREDDLRQRGVCRVARRGRSEVMAIQVRPWLDTICSEIRANLSRYPDDYEPNRIQAGLGK